MSRPKPPETLGPVPLNGGVSCSGKPYGGQGVNGKFVPNATGGCGVRLIGTWSTGSGARPMSMSGRIISRDPKNFRMSCTMQRKSSGRILKGRSSRATMPAWISSAPAVVAGMFREVTVGKGSCGCHGGRSRRAAFGELTLIKASKLVVPLPLPPPVATATYT